MKMIDNKICLRKTTCEDRDILYVWANDKETRKNSFSNHEISYLEHCNWFENALKNKSKVMYIVMYHELPVGQVRIDINNDVGEVSYSIAPEHRGKGFGQKALNLIKSEVQLNYPEIKYLVGKVKPENVASACVFQKEGFQECFRQFEFEIKS